MSEKSKRSNRCVFCQSHTKHQCSICKNEVSNAHLGRHKQERACTDCIIEFSPKKKK